MNRTRESVYESYLRLKARYKGMILAIHYNTRQANAILQSGWIEVIGDAPRPKRTAEHAKEYQRNYMREYYQRKMQMAA